MNIIKVKKGTSKTLHLNNTALITGLVVADFTFVCYSSSAAVTSTNASFSVTELETDHYAASVTFTNPGSYYVSITYSTYTEDFQIEVDSEDLSLLSRKVGTAESDYVFTANDSEGAIVTDATVRLFDSGGTKLLTKGLTGADGKVTFTLPIGSYKARVSKTGYDFSSVNPVSVTVTADADLSPIVSEFIPTSVSASSALCIKGLHFVSTSVVFVNGSSTTITGVSTDNSTLLLDLPAGLTSSVAIKVGNPDSSNPGSFHESQTYNLLVV